MNYLDVYWRRINHLGETTAERIKNGGIRSFQKWLNESPHTIKDLSVERGLYFSGIILTNKDKEHEKIMFLNVANNIPLLIGDIMNWPLENGEIEKWILIQEEKKVNGSYRTFWIVRCNYIMKWIDNQGHVQESWSYFVSSLDSKIKGNFRTWNNLITPQPNKYAEVLMPRKQIERSTNFIVEEESWSVIEYDYTSVPGIIYLSLTENKINLIYDDIKNNIADTDKLADYTLLLPEGNQTFNINQPIIPVFTLQKNGITYNGNYGFKTTDKSKARIIDGVLTAVGEGTVDIIVYLIDYPEIMKTITVEITNENIEFSAYIDGNDAIRLDREESYKLVSNQDILDKVTFTLVTTDLAKIKIDNDNQCTIRANASNKLGTITLIAQYNNQEYSKTISIIPLW